MKAPRHTAFVVLVLCCVFCLAIAPSYATPKHEIDSTSLPTHVSLLHRNSTTRVMLEILRIQSPVMISGEYAFFTDEGMVYNKLLVGGGIGLPLVGYGFVDTWVRWTHGNKHRLEITAGVAYQYQHRSEPPEKGISFSNTLFMPTYMLGYRYNYDNGLFLRSNLNFMYDKHSTGWNHPFSITVSIGYAFR